MKNELKQALKDPNIKFHAILWVLILPVLYFLHQKNIISGGMVAAMSCGLSGVLLHHVVSYCIRRKNS
ncbi:hypothetical protein B2M27_15505 (plasmid) [Kluyvera intermedia]|uniref:Uncharacterized protein n=1 Tax=Kluyvera intermedia TaxID=61648 RepID=A0ABX3UE10_KLUIN|nr:hypothetical protein B2M27_15505 [Kluyvera intermedia]